MNPHKNYSKENVSILNKLRHYYHTRMKHYNANNPPLVAESEITDGEQSTAQEKYVSYIQSYFGV